MEVCLEPFLLSRWHPVAFEKESWFRIVKQLISSWFSFYPGIFTRSEFLLANQGHSAAYF